jgi:hypothetical protein
MALNGDVSVGSYSLDELAEIYDKYPASIVALHQILKDVSGKQELSQLEVVDGEVYGMHMYFLQGVLSSGNKRILMPLAFDGIIDIIW